MIQIDMKMPESCKECRFFDKEDLCYIDDTYAISDEQIKTKPKWCPLIDVPEANTIIDRHIKELKGENNES